MNAPFLTIVLIWTLSLSIKIYLLDYNVDIAAHISLCTKLHLFIDVLCVLRITSLC